LARRRSRGTLSSVRWIALLLAACTVEAPLLDGGVDAGPDAGAPSLAQLIDDEGRVVILRGTNVSGDSKDPPDFMPNDFETEEDFARLRDELGMNAIRYLVFWEAIEPEQGTYDTAYLEEVHRRVAAAIAAGLFVVVDMHQDVYGRGFGFDGAPAWTCDEALYTSFDMNRPSEWYLGYARPEVQECFDRFYTEHRTAFARAWAELARVLSDLDVFAYEVLNEPSWGSMAVTSFERNVLPAFYTEVIDAIRAVDPEPYVMIEPSSTANVGLGTDLIAPDRPRLVLAPHVYPPGLETGSGWTGNREFLDDWLEGLRRDALQRDLPLVITELGARPSIDGALRYLDEVYDALDAAGLGALQWDASRGSYGIYADDGTISEVGAAVARPYPSRTSGTPILWSWDGARFTYTWTDRGEGETVIMAPSVAFPDGFDVSDAGAIIDGSVVRIPSVAGERSIVITRR
jgi:endoglycosylceramidase